jgi:hypothetical protein
LRIPPRTIAEDEVRRIFEVARIVTEGIVRGDVSEVRIPASRQTARQILEIFIDERMPTMFLRNVATAEILDTRLDLGEAFTTINQLRVPNDEVRRINIWLEQPNGPSDNTVRLVATKDTMHVVTRYAKWGHEDAALEMMASAMTVAEIGEKGGA